MSGNEEQVEVTGSTDTDNPRRDGDPTEDEAIKADDLADIPPHDDVAGAAASSASTTNTIQAQEINYFSVFRNDRAFQEMVNIINAWGEEKNPTGEEEHRALQLVLPTTPRRPSSSAASSQSQSIIPQPSSEESITTPSASSLPSQGTEMESYASQWISSTRATASIISPENDSMTNSSSPWIPSTRATASIMSPETATPWITSLPSPVSIASPENDEYGTLYVSPWISSTASIASPEDDSEIYSLPWASLSTVYAEAEEAEKISEVVTSTPPAEPDTAATPPQTGGYGSPSELKIIAAAAVSEAETSSSSTSAVVAAAVTTTAPETEPGTSIASASGVTTTSETEEPSTTCACIRNPKMKTPEDSEDEDELADHLGLLDFRRYQCQFCPSRFEYFSSLETHKILQHWKRLKRKAFNCPFCDKNFNNLLELKEHFKTSFSNEDEPKNDNRHRRKLLKTEFPLRCGICNKGIFNDPCFRYHLLKDHHIYRHMRSSEALHVCGICQRPIILMNVAFYHLKSFHKDDNKENKLDDENSSSSSD